MRKASAILLLGFLTAGCWQSHGSLHGNDKPVEPLRTGKVFSTSPDNPKEVSHAVLTRGQGGAYRLTNADRGSPDFGDAFVVRFFTLAGLPAGVFVFEAVADDKCEAGRACNRMTAASERYYGLMRLTKGGAEVTSPDCDPTSPAAKLPGVKASSYGTCTFTSRASLERALLAQVVQPWKINLTYKYE